MSQTQILSKNQKIVLDIIEKAKSPLKAYSILFNVQKKGMKFKRFNLVFFCICKKCKKD